MYSSRAKVPAICPAVAKEREKTSTAWLTAVSNSSLETGLVLILSISSRIIAAACAQVELFD